MSTESLKARLLALAGERTIIQRMADVLPEIEMAMEAGASRKQIVEALNAEGIAVSAQMFSTYVQRLRDRANRKPIPLPAPQQPASTVMNIHTPSTAIKTETAK